MWSLHERISRLEAAVAALNRTITRQGDKLMTALSDLQGAVASIKSDVSAVGEAITALVSAIGSNDDAGVEAAVADLQEAHTSLQASVTSASSALPPAP